MAQYEVQRAERIANINAIRESKGLNNKKLINKNIFNGTSYYIEALYYNA